MFNISNKNLASLAINTTCALTNAYLAPYTFTLSFLVGTTVGLGIGLKRRINVLFIDYNQKAADAVKDQTNKTTAKWQDQIKGNVDRVSNMPAVKYIKESTGKFYPYIKPLINLYLTISGYGAMITKAKSYVMGFDEQRLAVIRSLNPIPGLKGTLFSVGALAANIGYLTLPILSKMWVFSGITAGYATGLAVMRHTDFRWLQSDPYDQALKITLYGNALTN